MKKVYITICGKKINITRWIKKQSKVYVFGEGVKLQPQKLEDIIFNMPIELVDGNSYFCTGNVFSFSSLQNNEIRFILNKTMSKHFNDFTGVTNE